MPAGLPDGACNEHPDGCPPGSHRKDGVVSPDAVPPPGVDPDDVLFGEGDEMRPWERDPDAWNPDDTDGDGPWQTDPNAWKRVR